MRALLLLSLLVMALPPACAQSLINPVRGDFASTYLIYGRAIDAQGKPVVYGTVNATLAQEGVQPTSTPIGTDCYGFFIGYFTIGNVDPHGTLTVTLEGPAGQATDKHGLDPFYRRSDFTLTYPGAWQGPACRDKVVPLWEGRVSVSGRLVERVAPYTENGATLTSRAHPSYLRLTWVDQHGVRACPPQGDDPRVCETIPTDERGDFRYSWTYNESIEPIGHVEVDWGNATTNLTMDPKMRIAFGEIEVNGQGPAPVGKPAPIPSAPLATLALVGTALAARRLLPKYPR